MARRSPLLSIFLIVLVDVLGLTIVIPLLAIYAETFKATPLQATLLVTTYAVFQLVSSPILGKISDRTGRKPMLIVSQLGTFVGFILLARSTSLWMLYVARAIDGATAGNLPLAQAYISDNTEPKNRAKSFALIGIAFGLGFTVGPAVTAYLSRYGLNIPIYAAAGLSLTSVLCTSLLLPKERAPASQVAEAELPAGKRLGVLDWDTYAQYLKRPVLRGLLAQFFAYMIAFQMFTSGFALFAERRFVWHGHPFTPFEIGMVFTYVGILGILLQGGAVGRLVKRFGEGPLVAWGFVSLVAGYLLLGPVSAIPFLIAAITLSSFGGSILRPVITSMVTQSASRTEQGVVLGLTTSLSSLAAIGAPPVAGFLIDHALLSWWAWLAAGASLLGLVGARWGSARVARIPSPRAQAA